jgi:hypothetical protein
MSGRRLIVVESSEVSPHALRWYAARQPAGAIARLLWEGALRTTVDHDNSEQGEPRHRSWSRLATGAATPGAHPPYWQLAAHAGRTVGVVGTPAAPGRPHDPAVAFAVPAGPDPAVPARYASFQRLVRALGERQGSAGLGPLELVALAASWRLGVRPRTLTTLAKRRMRGAVFAVQADVFQTLLWKRDPELAVLRADPLVGRAAERPESAEALLALGALDRVIAELRTHCEATDRALVVVSTAGALLTVGLDLDGSDDEPIDVLDVAPTILDALGVNRQAHHRGSRLRPAAVTTA